MNQPWVADIIYARLGDGRAYRDTGEATAAIGRFIEDMYNRQRLHSALADQSPMAFEATRPIPGSAEQQVAAPVIRNCP